MKTICVESHWEGLHDVEVSDEWEHGDPLPDTAFDQITAETVSLIDWDVARA